jgi:hypothetical protein
MMRMRDAPAVWTVWTTVRLIGAVVVVAAIVAQGFSTIGGAAASGEHVPTAAANFFSYFTILSNAATAIVLAWSALCRLPGADRTRLDPRGLTTAFAYVTTYMLITGVVYNALLRAISIGPDTVRWANEVMHVGAPLLLLLDLLLGPGHRPLPWRAAVGAALFPILWIVYTMLRAPFITAPGPGTPYWYPYPFLDPNGPAGWGGVWTYIIAIAAGIILVAFGVVAVLRLRARRSVRRRARTTPG